MKMAMQGTKLWFNTMKHTLLQVLLHDEEDVATFLIKNNDDNVHNECVKILLALFCTTCTYFCVLLKFAFMCYAFSFFLSMFLSYS